MTGYEGWQYTHDGVRVGARMVARAQNENELLVPGTVFVSYHGEGRPWGRTTSDSNHHITKATYLDDFQLACIDMILKVARTRGPIVPSIKPLPTTSSTTLTYEQLEKQIDKPTFELSDRPTLTSDWGGKFSRDRALEIESALCMEFFQNRYLYHKTKRGSRLHRRRQKGRQAYFDKLEVPANVDPEEVDREYRKFLAAQERDAVERGRPAESGGGGNTTNKQGLFSNRFYSADDIEGAARRDNDSDDNNTQQHGTAWSEGEKTHFFELLGRVGRHRLKEIAETIGTKSLAEVEEYHDLLYTASEHQKEMFSTRLEAGEMFIPERDRPVSYKDIPAAAEMSDKWIALEESFAHGIAARSNEAPLPKGEEPFESLHVDDLVEEEEEEEGEEEDAREDEEDEEPEDLFNNNGFLSLASKIFYPNPANGMDIQCKEYNTDLPVFKGIEADAMKELLVATVERTRQLVTDMSLVDGNQRTKALKPETTGGSMQFLQGLRYSSVSRFFRQYFERSGSERVETLFPEVRFPESVLTSKTVNESVDQRKIKLECKNINFLANPRLLNNTALLSASMANVSRSDKKKFLDAEEQKRVEGLLHEQRRYAELIDEGDVAIIPEEEESDLPDVMLAYELRKKLLNKTAENPDTDHLYPMEPFRVPQEFDFMHLEETGFLERLDERNSQIEETGLTRLLAAAAPYRYSRIFQEINKKLYEQDKKCEDDFVKEKLRYKYDGEGKEINLWKQQLPEVRETYNYAPAHKFPLYGSEPDTHKRGPGGGLIQPDNAYPETVPYEVQAEGQTVQERPIHTDGSVVEVYKEQRMKRSFKFRRPKKFFGTISFSVTPGEGGTHEVMDHERISGNLSLIDGMRQHYHNFTGTPPSNPYDIYYDEEAVHLEADPVSNEETDSREDRTSGFRRTRVATSESNGATPEPNGTISDGTGHTLKKRRVD